MRHHFLVLRMQITASEIIEACENHVEEGIHVNYQVIIYQKMMNMIKVAWGKKMFPNWLFLVLGIYSCSKEETTP